MEQYALYMIKDEFFQDFPDPYLKGNKQENRPHYYAMKDKKTGLYWMIPLSSKTEKYKKILKEKESQNKPCDILHIVKFSNKESVFLIHDVFPVTEDYILRPYTINGNPVKLMSEKQIKIIQKKLTKILGLRRRGIVLTDYQADIFAIEKKLLECKVTER